MKTAKETAEILEIDYQTLLRLRAQGKINGVRHGKAYKFTDEEIQRVLKEGW